MYKITPLIVEFSLAQHPAVFPSAQQYRSYSADFTKSASETFIARTIEIGMPGSRHRTAIGVVIVDAVIVDTT
ncbi:hypothetical protein [Cupriavidus sp. EM10]|uniref:hypothetical protein n=1 Tax=Cupriavidus sp. EM10 TaxID=2839983 RepID=UPI001C000E34|nr:hypothetical protein [Cupriavidus sp. EM10]QWE98162.1 hypothetical protein KLP38_28580 [Cupriavidus sp. EM10]